MSYIVYAQNPLRSYVVLEEGEEAILRQKLYDYHRYEWEESQEDSENWTEHQYPYVLESLTSGEEHCGDCTKVPCSCTKCYAEEIWGVDTAKGIKCFRYISGAFGEGRTTIAEAIADLSKPGVYDEEWHQPHIERWEAERQAALESLIAYRDQHFPE